MTAPMTRLPVMPSRSDPANFSARGDAGMTALPIMVDEFNERLPVIDAAVQAGIDAVAAAAAAAASAATALAAPGTTATSTTPLTVSAGALAIVIQANKDIVSGAWLMCARTADPDGVWMLGQVRSYTKATGALVLVVATGDTKGTGTFNDWTLSLSSARSTVLNAVDLALVGPSIRPSLLCDFANSKRLDSRFTYTMASPLSYYDAAGVLRYAAPGVPAFDHDPATGKCLGWSTWESRANIAPYSEQIDTWTKVGASVSPNAAVSPDGSASADKLVEDTSSGGHQAYSSASVTSGAQYTFSVYVKAAGRTKVSLRFNANNGAFADSVADFDLSTGGGTNVSCNSATIQKVGNGYWRCTATETALASATGFFSVFLNNGAGIGYTGDGVSGAHLWGAQIEAGAFVTPYIPTPSGTAVTRSAPTLTMATSAFDFNAAEGTIHVIFNSSDDVTQMCAVELSDGTASNLVTIPAANTSGVGPYGEIVVGGVTQAALTDGNLAANSLNSAVLAYKANDFAFCRNGRSVVMDASGAVPPMSTLILGRSVAGNSFNGWLSKFAYYSRRLVNSEPVALSTL